MTNIPDFARMHTDLARAEEAWATGDQVGALKIINEMTGRECTMPHLGLATNADLLNELSVRIEIHFRPGGLNYRTFNGEELAMTETVTDGT